MFLACVDNITIPSLVLLFPQDGFGNSTITIVVSGQVQEQLGCWQCFTCASNVWSKAKPS